jgi:hypothetical protein
MSSHISCHIELISDWQGFKRNRGCLIHDYLAEQDLPPTVEPAIERTCPLKLSPVAVQALVET